MKDAMIVELKKKINNLVWEYSPAQTTLEKAEFMACEILNIIRNVNEREEPKEKDGQFPSCAFMNCTKSREMGSVYCIKHSGSISNEA